MSPLNKRLPRVFMHNPGKWLGIVLLLVLSISIVAGFLMASSSMTTILSTSDEDYCIEDGRFTSNFQISNAVIGEIENLGVSVYPNFSYDVALTAESSTAAMTARIYENRQNLNLAAYFEGQAPVVQNEIALDRVFCKNNNITVGDTVYVNNHSFIVSGIMSLSDYQALFEKNTDFVFNAQTFSVAQVSEEGFKTFQEKSCTYTYSFIAHNRTLTNNERTNLEQDIMSVLEDNNVVLSEFLDRDANNGIGYAEDDIKGDSTVWQAMMYLLVIILAFVFVVLTSSTIEEESTSIGTLLALGYRKSEILLHYLALPLISGIVGAGIGNALGFMFCIEAMANLYYNSYSLPPYYTIWDWGVFVQSTLFPLLILIVVTLIGLARKLHCTPLQFLRREISVHTRKSAGIMPSTLSFARRFRLHLFGRNISHFVTLFIGILFASLLLLFGFCILPTVNSYASSLADNLASEHTYILKAPVELAGTPEQREQYDAALTLARNVDMASLDETTNIATIDLGNLSQSEFLSLVQKASNINEDSHVINTVDNGEEKIAQAEKFVVESLEYDRGNNDSWESISLYGIQTNSRYYTSMDFGNNATNVGNVNNAASGSNAANNTGTNGATSDSTAVAAGLGFTMKFNLAIGDNFELYDKYKDATYTFTIASIWGNCATMNVYMPIDAANALLENDADYFNGYFSNQALEIDELYLASDITPEQMDKIGAQMESSMSGTMSMLVGIAVAIYVVLMYLLTKTVIERNARAISYMKVFGYTNKEINGLYVRTITEVVIVSLLAAIPLIVELLSLLVKAVFMRYNGNFIISLPSDRIALEIALGIACYVVVAFIHMRHIKRVPLSLTLKTQE